MQCSTLGNQLNQDSQLRLYRAVHRLNQTAEFDYFIKVLQQEKQQLVEQLVNAEGRALTIAQGKAQQLDEVLLLCAQAREWLEQQG